ncbi:hypothetical protein [Roseibacillus ishigakijimensis]|uniref:Uncharacterized protein n=1 Tax=Roseibacillus ishigakijimensis TaxID=454146 RepID=A0A934RL50_9BACT|nr:hypothetical protein [Roseibacillus ishigakijimensis]MBK1832853.1 hypothetical protein [Roseibacillus ishigakijimensis]
MIPLDPEEIFGCAIWDAVRRVLAVIACLYLGSFVAFLAAGFCEILGTLIGSGLTVFPSFAWTPELLILPFWSFGSLFGILTATTIFLALIYYLRVEETSWKKFLQFATLQQIALAGTLADHSLALGLVSSPVWQTVLALLGNLFFQLQGWAFMALTLFFLKIKQRQDHEIHLLNVAAENARWREKVESLEHIPPPPSGPKPPQPRPL